MPRDYPNSLPAVLPATLFQIERRLPAPGELLIQAGSRVEPDDLIGQCKTPQPPVVLDLASALDVEPRELPRYVRRAVGMRVVFRDLLAKRGSRRVLAPFKGTITAIDTVTGLLILTPDPVLTTISAMFRGYIVHTEVGNAATIETAAAVVQGAVGFGGERWGMLRMLTDDPATPLTPDMIDARCAFSIIVGGSGLSAEVLERARQEHVRAVIVGSAEAEVLHLNWGSRFDGSWNNLLQTGSVPTLDDEVPAVMLTEGFGSHAMSRPVFELLAELNHQEAYINGMTQLAAPQRRPQLVVPLARLPKDTAPQSPSHPSSLIPGSYVRLLSEKYLGEIGRIESLDRYGRLPSGVRTRTALVQIGETQRIMVPAAMLELL